MEPLSRWVHKDSTICIDLTVDKITLFSMGFKNIVQAAATDNAAKHNNSAVMEYLRRIVPRMFQNTLSLLSRQMIQQFLDELVWRESFGTYALQAFNNIIIHIAEQTRVTTNETITQRLYQVSIKYQLEYRRFTEIVIRFLRSLQIHLKTGVFCHQTIRRHRPMPHQSASRNVSKSSTIVRM